MNAKNRQKYIWFFIIILFMLLHTGCWDYRELENRGYVLAVAIDKAGTAPKEDDKEKNGLSHRDLEKMPLESGKPKYAYTIQIPIIVRGQAKPAGQGGGGGGGGQQERTWDLTFTGNSFFEVNREFSTRLDYPPTYEHLQAIVISEDAAREGIIGSLDVLLRDPETRRRTRVFITPQNAYEFLKVIPKIDDYSAMYLANLPLNAYKTSRMAHKTDLGIVSKNLHTKEDFSLPRIICDKEEIKNAGIAVFKKDKMVGWLGEIDTAYTKWITNVAIGGTVVIEMPGNPGSQLALEIKKVNTEVRPIIDDSSIKMQIKTKAELDISDESSKVFTDKLNDKFIKQAKEIAEKKIREEMADTIEYVQNQYGTDIFEFDINLQRYAPAKWKEVKDNWDDLFSQVETVIDVDVNINQIGLIK